ncbi:MAG: ABC transporter permease [Deltaproteobacteria bacterium]|jgi:spermidine/putrescine transport system permease protein|nr:ABC transporter permease [Deltaproteobacteria bacterium]
MKTSALSKPSFRGNYRKQLLGFATAFPALLCLTVFLAVPCMCLVLISFVQRGEFGDIRWAFSLENYKRLFGFSLYGWSPDFLFILLRSLREAFVTTLICIVISYPLGFFIHARKSRFSRLVWLVLLNVPFCTNIVIRTYAWQLILGPGAPLAEICAFLGVAPPGTPLYPGTFAVYLGMISTFLPFTALPLYAAIDRMNWSLVLAAKDLYATRFKIFTQAVFPQTVHGLFAGIIITFVPAMAMYVVTDILGGARYMLIGNLIQLQFAQARDWPFGATLSLALMVLTLFSFALFKTTRLTKDAGIY